MAKHSLRCALKARDNYRFAQKGPAIREVLVDGNRAILVLAAPLKSANRLIIKDVEDTPALRLYKDTPLNKMQQPKELMIVR